jgi:4'-phosphopantetheinyl transferase
MREPAAEIKASATHDSACDVQGPRSQGLRTGADDRLSDPQRVDLWRARHHEGISPPVERLLAAEVDALTGMVEPHRSRRLWSRVWLRTVLGGYLGVPPVAVEFAYGAFGKPHLGATFASSGIEFNLSTTSRALLIAVTRAGPVGVDVEAATCIPDAQRLVRRFFASSEATVLDALGDDHQSRRFLRYWTAKEAYTKALGCGLAVSLDEFVVPQEFLGRDRVNGWDARAGRWSLIRADPFVDTIGTLVVRSSSDHLSVVTGDLEDILTG